ncbi:ABC transporter permease subunit [Streptomyces sp. NPDC051555]|uniref:ABC transporter permease subunit n=1 Tax=Streptomyces sp. NPDC051555 TaxID=3365657 RepID=UPI00379E3B52
MTSTSTSTSTPDHPRGHARTRKQNRNEDHNLKRSARGGLLWLVLRQQRLALAAFALAATGIVLYAVMGRSATLDAIAHLRLPLCPEGEGCQLPPEFSTDHVLPLRGLLSLLTLLPVALGLFLGAPLFAQELESGTYRTVLSQSVTRSRWFLAKVSLPLVLAVIVSAAASWAATSWWSTVAGRLGSYSDWSSWMPYDAIGPAPVARSVLMVSIGIVFGLVLRRTVTAMGATVVTAGALLVVLERYRGALRPTVTDNLPITDPLSFPGGAWVQSRGLLTNTGAPAQELPECTVSGGLTGDHFACLRDHGITRQWVSYHPKSHLWPIQYTESAICLALSLLALAGAWWWTRKRMS